MADITGLQFTAWIVGLSVAWVVTHNLLLVGCIVLKVPLQRAKAIIRHGMIVPDVALGIVGWFMLQGRGISLEARLLVIGSALMLAWALNILFLRTFKAFLLRRMHRPPP